MDEQAKVFLALLKSDFRLYARKLLKIRTKDGDIVKLKLNKAQIYFIEKCREQLASVGYIRIVVLKGRQQGLSTVIAGLLYHKTSMNSGQKTVVVAHKDEASRTLFAMTKRFHESIPEPIRATTRASNRKELVFAGKHGEEGLDSSYIVMTAGGVDPGRSETLQGAHLSEVAFWPRGSAAENFNGMLKAVPRVKGSMCFVESTANGVSGVFYELWQGAVEGRNDFCPVFIPWFWDDGYQMPVPKGFQITPDERDLMKRYKLTLPQIVWRRNEVGVNGLDKFKQEYPCCAEEAFLTSGSPIFTGPRFEEMQKAVCPPLKTLIHIKGLGFRENERGMLKIWKEPEPGRTYTIGGDVASGVQKRDYSVASVLDDERRVVAVFRGWVDPEYFADVLNDLGKYYNTARIIVERNNHGLMTCTRLYRDLEYPNFYTEETLDRETQTYRKTLGFWTGEHSKALIIDQLRAAVRDGLLKVEDSATLREMLSYVLREDGRMGAENGKDVDGEDYHDDTVIALALAHHIYRGKPKPIQIPATAYSYVP